MNCFLFIYLIEKFNKQFNKKAYNFPTGHSKDDKYLRIFQKELNLYNGVNWNARHTWQTGYTRILPPGKKCTRVIRRGIGVTQNVLVSL